MKKTVVDRCKYYFKFILVSMKAYLVTQTGHFINHVFLVLLTSFLRLRSRNWLPVVLTMNFRKSATKNEYAIGI